MKIAVIVDNGRVQRFALDALNAIEGTDKISVFSCRNTRLKKKLGRHAAYYALNLLTVRNRLTQFVPIASGKKAVASTVEFDAEPDGAWQRLPSPVIHAAHGFDVILKFGMGLLRIPADLPVPILSYHHGDPDAYRGRPAGFWEIADGTPVMGQVVQVIGDKLDAGEIVAFAETKVYPWSYRATLMEAYRHSPLIIKQAISNALAGTYLPKARSGRNCRLPSNWTTARFVTRTASHLAKRLMYGATREKAWRVSTARVADEQRALAGEGFPAAQQWRTLEVAPGYRFYADPFFLGDDGAVLVEALNGRTGLGEIVRIEGDTHEPLLKGGGHISYPSTARLNGREIVIPEMARWSSPVAYEADGKRLRPLTTLKVECDPRVLDPTLFEHDGRFYLFGNIRKTGSNALYLWHASSLEDVFKLHPESPVRISPRGSRMGGGLIKTGGGLFRLGQDFSGAYGDGLFAFEVEELSPETYRERLVGRIKFPDRKGPHTLNFRPGEVVFDWYEDRITPLAGIRRLLSRRRG